MKAFSDQLSLNEPALVLGYDRLDLRRDELRDELADFDFFRGEDDLDDDFEADFLRDLLPLDLVWDRDARPGERFTRLCPWVCDGFSLARSSIRSS